MGDYKAHAPASEAIFGKVRSVRAKACQDEDEDPYPKLKYALEPSLQTDVSAITRRPISAGVPKNID